jgi:hypothetical protein
MFQWMLTAFGLLCFFAFDLRNAEVTGLALLRDLRCIAQEAVKKGNRRFLAIGFQQEHPT